MAFLFQNQQKNIPNFTGLQINTAVQVLPIPLMWGMPRVPINLVYYNGFNQKEVSAGKGFLTGGKGTLAYFATVILAIGEGPITDVKMLFVDQAVYVPGNFPNADSAVLFLGTDNQAPWSYVVTNWPADARPYKDTAYYAFANYQLDSSATVPQVNVVPVAKFAGTCPLIKSSLTVTTGQYDQDGNPISFFGAIDLGYADADPAQVIFDFLTNPRNGARFPQEFVDTSSLFGSATAFDPDTGDNSISTYCQAVGIGWSPLLNNPESANSIMGRWTDNISIAPVWDGQMLRFYPYSTTYCGTNPGWGADSGIPQKFYNPPTQPTILITMDDILDPQGKEEHPISFSRIDPQKIYNSVRLDYKDRSNFYNNNIVEAKDEAHIEKYGLQVDNVGQADELTHVIFANAAAQMRLRRNIAVTRTYKWKLGPLWGFLDPMDIVQIPDPANWSDQIVVRITATEDDDQEIVTVTAEDFPAAGNFTLLPTNPTTPPTQSATNIPSSPVYPPVIFEPTPAMLTATGFAAPQIILGASAGVGGQLDPFFGGANVYVSLDNVSYEKMPGGLAGASIIGSLVSGMVNATAGLTINVNTTESDGVLSSFPAASSALGQSLCIMQDAQGFELFGYTTATLTSSFNYALTGLTRGMYGTTARAFGAGSEFLFVGSNANYYERALPPQFIGHTLYVKLQAFNVFKNFLQDLATCVPYTYLVNGGSPPNIQQATAQANVKHVSLGAVSKTPAKAVVRPPQVRKS